MFLQFHLRQAPPPRPPPPGQGAFTALSVPRVGASANLERSGGRVLANPGGSPEKIVDVFKGVFS